MKYINLSWIFCTLALCGQNDSKNSFQPESNHTIRFFIKDQQSKQIRPDLKIMVNYAGYDSSSNYEGEVVLPRKTQDHQLFILITPLDQPQFGILNNLSHWQVPTDQPAHLYQLDLASDNKKPVWQVKLIDLPGDRHVPLHTIVVLANPEVVQIPTGKFSTLPGEQLRLPDLYSSQSPTQTNNLFENLNHQPFFGKLITAYELTPYGYATITGRSNSYL